MQNRESLKRHVKVNINQKPCTFYLIKEMKEDGNLVIIV